MIHTITATRNHPQAPAHQQELYCFDNEAFDLIAEPLVESTTQAIRDVLRWAELPDATAVTLRFSSEEAAAKAAFQGQDHPVIELVLLGPKDDGHNYELFLLRPQQAVETWASGFLTEEETICWLCPVLLQYFPAGAPERLFVQIQPLSA